MGHKINPKSVRLGYTRDWDSRWFNLKDMPSLIEEDRNVRIYVKNKLKLASVSKIEIERRGANFLKVNVYTSRPGIVIGKGGQGIETLKKEIEIITGRKTFVSVMEIKRPEVDAQLVAESIAYQLEKQIVFRRAMKKAIEKAMLLGAQGIKVMVAGRLGGAEIARTEWLREGRIPLQTFRADIDYGFTEAYTTMGQIGVKVWIFKKEYFKKTVKDLINEAKQVNAENVVSKSNENQSNK
ncbi:MAG: 30S ribosomal protein S3 [Elusimicrobiota bacterium]|jgi:small subunit ribosomal protein S3|nr:30S ribosomal protein S3 [Elusimicrobiota bacterium]